MNRRNFFKLLAGAGAAVAAAPVLKLFPPSSKVTELAVKPIVEVKALAIDGFRVERDYYFIEWPVVSREWQFGTYADATLLHFNKDQLQML